MICPECEGTGKCSLCDGSGLRPCENCKGEGFLSFTLLTGEIKRNRCPFCNGRGEVFCKIECKTCEGFRIISEGDLKKDISSSKYREYTELVSWQILLIIIIAFIFSSISLLLFQKDYILMLFGCNGIRVMKGEIWRLVTSMFVHIGFAHFIINSYALLLVCPPIERAIGKSKFIGIYYTSGLLGKILTVMLLPKIWSAGASGAIYGILGTYLGLQNRYRLFKSAFFYRICLIIVTDTIVALIPGMHINLIAHFGGLISGFILSSFIRLEENREKNDIEL